MHSWIKVPHLSGSCMQVIFISIWQTTGCVIISHQNQICTKKRVSAISSQKNRWHWLDTVTCITILFHDTFTGVYKILFDLRFIMPAMMNTTPTTIVSAITESTMPATAPAEAKLTVVCTSQHLICFVCCHTMYTLGFGILLCG